VLPDHLLVRALEAKVVASENDDIPVANVQPASIDLRLGPVAYRARCSFLPGRDPVEERLKALVIDELDLSGEGTVLETNRPYLIPLKERLHLPEVIKAKANPKSSTGRLDVFCRVITDHSYRFDEVAAGYCGKLWLEVVPLSFAVKVREDLCLNQLRLSIGHSELDDADVGVFYQKEHPLMWRAGRPVPEDEVRLSRGLFLGLDLSNQGVGFRARENAPLLDLTDPRPRDLAPYWEAVAPDEPGRVILSASRFYLLMSEEAVSVPPSLASEMTAYDPTSGELRTHYAGFFDPGFGFDAAGRSHGSRAALEVRAHDVPFMIEHGQRVCKLTFERMLEEPSRPYGSAAGSSYQGQEVALGKHFVRHRGPGES
jgi:dCTP deaminase